MELMGFLSLGILILLQITIFAFGYGKLSEKVSINRDTIKEISSKYSALSINVAKIEQHLTEINGSAKVSKLHNENTEKSLKEISESVAGLRERIAKLEK